MLEFEVNGVQYRATKLSAMQQLHLTRRIAPLVPPLMPLFMKVARASQADGIEKNIDAIAALAGPLADGLAGMGDEQAEYVINTCLSVVKRHHDQNWAAVWNPTAKLPMFPDLNDIYTLLPIVMQVIRDNLGPFIQGILTGATPPEAPPAA